MISITPHLANSYVNFAGKKSEKLQEQTPIQEPKSSFGKKLAIPTVAMLMYLSPMSSAQASDFKTFEPTPCDIEMLDPTETTSYSVNEMIETRSDTITGWNKTQLKSEELLDAPSPKITVKGKEINAGIVVDRSTNRLYRYDEEGNAVDGYHIATGVIGKKGQSITHPGIRYVDEIETYPYKEFPGTKRARTPKAFGPNILHLVMVDPQKGVLIDSNGKYVDNGEYIHGNENAASIGKYASHGCMRMDNTVIKMMAKDTPVGTYVLIK